MNLKLAALTQQMQQLAAVSGAGATNGLPVYQQGQLTGAYLALRWVLGLGMEPLREIAPDRYAELAALASPMNTPPVTASLGSYLRQLREQQGLGVRQVARTLGVSASTITRLENNERQPSPAVLQALMTTLAGDLQHALMLMAARATASGIAESKQ